MFYGSFVQTSCMFDLLIDLVVVEVPGISPIVITKPELPVSDSQSPIFDLVPLLSHALWMRLAIGANCFSTSNFYLVPSDL